MSGRRTLLYIRLAWVTGWQVHIPQGGPGAIIYRQSFLKKLKQPKTLIITPIFFQEKNTVVNLQGSGFFSWKKKTTDFGLKPEVAPSLKYVNYGAICICL